MSDQRQGYICPFCGGTYFGSRPAVCEDCGETIPQPPFLLRAAGWLIAAAAWVVLALVIAMGIAANLGGLALLALVLLPAAALGAMGWLVDRARGR